MRLATARQTPQASAVMLERAAAPLPRLVSVVPLDGGLAAILFQDEASARPPVEMMLRTTFALTASEAAVAVLVHAGLTVEEMAARRRVSVNTLRTQLKSLMSKMDCRRQFEVVSLVARLAVWNGEAAGTPHLP